MFLWDCVKVSTFALHTMVSQFVLREIGWTWFDIEEILMSLSK